MITDDLDRPGGDLAGPRRTAFVNARLIDPASGLDERGAVLVEGERITDLGPQLFRYGVPEDAAVVDCRGQCLAPGLVDLRVDLGEPGFEHKETIATGAKAAAAGGVTSLACLPNTDPPIDSVAGLEFVARRAREVRQAKIFSYACLTRGAAGRDLAELGLLAEAGAVAFTDGDHAVADAAVMSRALSYASGFGLLVVQHPEQPDLARSGHMNGGETATRLGLAGIPRQAEVMQIERDLRLVEMTGARYHAAHVSTAEAVQVIAAAKARGLPVTCDTAPHYFTLTEQDIADYRTFFRVSPPLRTQDDREAIIHGLADGTIDAIASDHRPQDAESKRVPFAQASPGVVGLETLLAVSLSLVHEGHLDLADLLEKLTYTPAELLDLEAGRLAKGAPADMVLFDPDRPWRVTGAELRSKSKNTPFDALPVQGRVTRTVVDGRTVFSLDDRAPVHV